MIDGQKNVIKLTACLLKHKEFEVKILKISCPCLQRLVYIVYQVPGVFQAYI